jgi:sugar phosphate isomerase/epimerase
MKLGVFTVLFRDLPFEQMLDKVAELGLDAVELGTGNYPGDAHCKPDELLADTGKAKAFRQAIESRGLMISGLSQHGNPLHPDAGFRQQDRAVWEKTVRLAEVLEVPVVMAFSGCPGDHDGAMYPNWVTCPWPDDYSKILEWQWNDVVIPYWTEAAAFAERHGVAQIGFEMHPGFVVYNPETLLRLREAVGPQIGANLDPSHLFWQGIDIVEAVKLLGRERAIFHVHAKDTYIDRGNVARNGILDTKHYGEILDRAWSFRSVGYGQGERTWHEFVSALRAVDYDYVLSMEHEDLLFSSDEGLRKGVELLQRLIPREGRTEVWWA